MVDSNEQRNMDSWRKKLFLGVEIPLPWLIGIIVALFFNAGVVYTKFDTIQGQNADFAKYVKEASVRADLVERRQERIEDRNLIQDNMLNDHEKRLRDVERYKK